MIRVDNGPEYVSGKLIERASKHHITLSHIQPGKKRNKTLTLSDTTELCATNGLELTYSTAFRRCKIMPHNGYGLTTTTAPTWG
tara:strand:- start:337 stop:588 length:252 start_codon:yes stop_codon:yes gene_type:complete